MRRIAILSFVVLAVTAAHVQTASAQNRARSDALDMEDKDRALVSKESVKAMRDKRNNERNNRRSGSSGKDDDCGSVDIGNDDNKKGSSRIAERQKTIIVTGNIINNANCR
ncbi:MAG: hypothetical protein ACOVOT_12055 [Rubrivivax sp.]|jgi:hypothetical protein|nr:hypothetical protein [Rubrivivax sp.]